MFKILVLIMSVITTACFANEVLERMLRKED